MTNQEIRELRMECLRLAVENGTPVEIGDPIQLAKTYYFFVTENELVSPPGQKPPPRR